MTRNKARLVANGYAKIGSIDLEKSFSPVAMVESIWAMFEA